MLSLLKDQVTRLLQQNHIQDCPIMGSFEETISSHIDFKSYLQWSLIILN